MPGLFAGHNRTLAYCETSSFADVMDSYSVAIVDGHVVNLDRDGVRPLDEKIRRAAEYYKTKYGQSPNRCYVNENALDSEREVDRL